MSWNDLCECICHLQRQLSTFQSIVQANQNYGNINLPQPPGEVSSGVSDSTLITVLFVGLLLFFLMALRGAKPNSSLSKPSQRRFNPPGGPPNEPQPTL